jgi:restriction system protein
MAEITHKVRTPLFPLYSEVRQLLTILNGVHKKSLTSMIYAIRDQTGTPQNPVDWSDPDTWISDRLVGEDADLARKIWEGSNGTVNPRYVYGAYLFINNYDLLTPDHQGIYRLEQRGQAFLNNDTHLLEELDDVEGLRQLLGILATKTQAKRSDLLPEWGAFLREYSRFGTSSTIKDALRRRLGNLLERGLVTREGIIYTITQSGIDYATPLSKAADDPGRHVLKTINTYNNKQRKALHQQLSVMPPYQFEHLVRDLLESMGYDDVQVTKEAGDKGVDVMGTVQFGITTVTEVVQVKRHKGNIGRPVLDQLRGSLPYHKAIRGTLITLGNFSKGCKEAALFTGAAPITLINGDKLLDLLIEHQIGIRKRPAQLYELDEDFFKPDDQAEPAGGESNEHTSLD